MPSSLSRNSHDLDADLGGTVAFLLGPHPRCFAGLDSVDAGLAMGGQQVGDGLALLHPAVDGGGEAVLEVVGVCSHAERA